VDKLLLLRDGRSEMFGPRDEVLAKLIPARPAAKVRARVVEPAAGPAIGVTAAKSACV
jgi:ATP-binding cassette, subfamily C, type I secretion system permease/ATPase